MGITVFKFREANEIQIGAAPATEAENPIGNLEFKPRKTFWRVCPEERRDHNESSRPGEQADVAGNLIS